MTTVPFLIHGEIINVDSLTLSRSNLKKKKKKKKKKGIAPMRTSGLGTPLMV
jgi:hypothetical protein